MLNELQNTLATGTKCKRRRKSALPFFSSKRIRDNIRIVLDDPAYTLTPAYSLALQAEHLLRVAEGTRVHGGDAPSADQ